MNEIIPRRIFDDAPAAWIFTTPQCLVLDANRAAEAIFVRPLASFRNKPLRLLIALSDRAIFSSMSSNLFTFPFNSSRPLAIQPLKGEEIDVIFRAALMRTPGGEPEFISWIFMEQIALPDLL